MKAAKFDLRRLADGVKARISLPELAGELGLERRGKLWRCPWHEDVTPSLSIREHSFRCFGCAETGDAITLLRKLTGWDFSDTLNFLAVRAGLDMVPGMRAAGESLRLPEPHDLPAPAPAKQPPLVGPERRREIFTAFCRSRVALLDSGAIPAAHPWLRYLEQRGISSATATVCGLGYVRNYRQATDWLSDSFPLADLEGSGLFNHKGNLRLFRHRLLLPYWRDGEAWGLQARNIGWRGDGSPKELTCGPVTVPYNVDALSGEPGQVFVCEGAMDCLSLVEQGLAAVAVPGANNFRPGWVELFEGWQVFVALDADKAGRAGAERQTK